MSWHIHAWLNEGSPRLEIVDADSGEVQLQWSLDESTAKTQAPDLQHLFRQLLLLSCKQDLRNGRLFLTGASTIQQGSTGAQQSMAG